jgi:hypothetical protein
MNRATCAMLCVLSLFVGLLLGPTTSNRAPAQQAPNAPAVGRYQVLLDNGGATLLVDTTTGEVWKTSGAFWVSQMKPVKN